MIVGGLATELSTLGFSTEVVVAGVLMFRKSLGYKFECNKIQGILV